MPFLEAVGRRKEIQAEERSEIGQWVGLGSQSLNGYERNRLYRNGGVDADGRPLFTDYGFLAGVDRAEDGRGAVVSDIDRDGDLDILVQSFRGASVLLVNGGQGGGHWLEVELEGTKSNRDALGARVVLETQNGRQLCEVGATGGYLAGQSRICHFGLGSAEEVSQLTVFWPSGAQSTLEGLSVNRRLKIVEGKDGVRFPAAKIRMSLRESSDAGLPRSP